MVTIIIMIAFFSMIIWLQLHLSQKENKWLGRILPMITFLLSLPILFVVINLYMDINHALNETATSELSSAMSPVTFFRYLITTNLPTFTLIMIYSSCRSKLKRNKALSQN